MSTLELRNVSYRYKKDGRDVLNNISYNFEKGVVYSITGKSGSGKTTILSLLAGLTNPTNGEIFFEGKKLTKLNKFDYRAKDAGVVFQSFNLLPHLTAAQNIELSQDASKKKYSSKKKELQKQLIRKVGLIQEDADKKILHLSGGEQQRVAIARAISADPEIILADEPTGNLDENTQNEIMNIFNELAHIDGKCVIIVTHSKDVANASDQVLELASLK